MTLEGALEHVYNPINPPLKHAEPAPGSAPAEAVGLSLARHCLLDFLTQILCEITFYLKLTASC